MTIGAKILIIAAVLCLLIWGIFLGAGAQLLRETGSVKVIYGEHEDFYGDAVVYQKYRNDRYYILHLPRARAAYRWWIVDFGGMTIAQGKAPRTLGSRKYLLRGDRGGTKVDNMGQAGEWLWHFTETGAALSGNGFTCSVRKIRK